MGKHAQKRRNAKSTAPQTTLSQYDEAKMDDVLKLAHFQNGKMTWLIDPAVFDESLMALLREDLATHLFTKLLKSDVNGFEKTYTFLRDLLGVDMERSRPPQQMAGPTLIMLMTPFQAAFTYGNKVIMDKIFELILGSKNHVLRAGIDAPIPMLARFLPHLHNPQPEKNGIDYVAMAVDMADRIAAALAQRDPGKLHPTTGYFAGSALAKLHPDLHALVTHAFDRHYAILERAALASEPKNPANDDQGATKSKSI